MRPIARGRGWFAAAAALTAAAALALIWALAEGESLANAIDDLPLLLLGAAVTTALWGWRETREGAAADRRKAFEERARPRRSRAGSRPRSAGARSSGRS